MIRLSDAVTIHGPAQKIRHGLARKLEPIGAGHHDPISAR
jgi:hypothetical protein